MKFNYIERPIYINKIIPFIGKNLIKVIVGQRQVGKSYLLYQIMDLVRNRNTNANIIYINKERYEFDSIKNYEDLIAYCNDRLSNSQENLLFIDEIQDIENFEKALRHFHSHGDIDIYCTGSNAKLLSGELATFLSGRFIEIKVFSLSYPEFLTFHNVQNDNQSLSRYLKIGGLPYLINLNPDDEVVFEYLNNIFSTIIYKDIISRYGIRNHVFLENLVHYLALNTGNLISAKKISDFLKSQHVKMSPQIVLDYLSFLENAFLIFKVKRKEITGKKIFETNEKYYFEDIGLKNAIVGHANFSINQIIENVIFNHLTIAGYSISVGISGDKEIDFVCEKDGKKLYVQAAYLIPDKKVSDREFGNLTEVKDNYRKIVVSMDEYAPENDAGIEHFRLIDFLTQINDF